MLQTLLLIALHRSVKIDSSMPNLYYLWGNLASGNEIFVFVRKTSVNTSKQSFMASWSMKDWEATELQELINIQVSILDCSSP